MKNRLKRGDHLFLDKVKDLLNLAFSGDKVRKLHQVQCEVLYYLTIEKLSPLEIKDERKTSIQATRQTINKLKALGLINCLNRPNEDVLGVTSSNVQDVSTSFSSHPTSPLKKYRLHGQNMTVKILKTSKQYWKILKEKTQEICMGNKVQLYRGKLTIYSRQSFYADEVDESFNMSDDYWTIFMRVLENQLGLNLVNGKYTTIFQFRCHIAKVGDDLARRTIRNKLNYAVIDDLGRLRLIIDNSKGLFEKEAVDHVLCQDDMKTIGNFELDMLELKQKTDEELKLSDILDFMKSSSNLHSNTNGKVAEISLWMSGIAEYNENIKLHMEVMKNINLGVDDMRKYLKQIGEKRK